MCSNLYSKIAQNRMLVSRVVPSVSESPDPAVSQVETNKPGYQNSSSLRRIQHNTKQSGELVREGGTGNVKDSPQ